MKEITTPIICFSSIPYSFNSWLSPRITYFPWFIPITLWSTYCPFFLTYNGSAYFFNGNTGFVNVTVSKLFRSIGSILFPLGVKAAFPPSSSFSLIPFTQNVMNLEMLTELAWVCPDSGRFDEPSLSTVEKVSLFNQDNRISGLFLIYSIKLTCILLLLTFIQ